MTQTCAKYSLVIFPTTEQSAYISSLKQNLRTEIGWFNSVNSAAHITIVEFWDDAELALYIDFIRKYCKNVIPSEVNFDHFDSFGDRTFYIAPNSESKKYLNLLMKNLHSFLKVKFPAQAHMTIARKLDADKMKTAFEFFKNTVLDFRFTCDAFHLRKFNDQTKQYSDVIEKFAFEGKPQPNLFDFS